MTIDNEKLAACPFCGGEAKRHTIGEDEPSNAGGDVIACTRCGASSHVEFGRKENLVSAWNTRTPQAGDELARELERIRQNGGKMFGDSTRVIDVSLIDRVLSRLTALTPTGAVYERMPRREDTAELMREHTKPWCSLEYRGGGDNDDALEYHGLWVAAVAAGDRWQKIANAMGYEPGSFKGWRQSEQWLADRVAKYRAALKPTGTDTAQSEAEQVKEAAAKVCEQLADEGDAYEADCAGGRSWFNVKGDGQRAAAAAIRAMPLPTSTDKERVLREMFTRGWDACAASANPENQEPVEFDEALRAALSATGGEPTGRGTVPYDPEEIGGERN